MKKKVRFFILINSICLLTLLIATCGGSEGGSKGPEEGNGSGDNEQLTNLISKEAGFTNSSGIITFYDELSGSTIEVTVQDNGQPVNHMRIAYASSGEDILIMVFDPNGLYLPAADVIDVSEQQPSFLYKLLYKFIPVKSAHAAGGNFFKSLIDIALNGADIAANLGHHVWPATGVIAAAGKAIIDYYDMKDDVKLFFDGYEIGEKKFQGCMTADDLASQMVHQKGYYEYTSPTSVRFGSFDKGIMTLDTLKGLGIAEDASNEIFVKHYENELYCAYDIVCITWHFYRLSSEGCSYTPPQDIDGDGQNSIVYGGNDRDDSHSGCYPGISEICDDKLDNDGDFMIDGMDADCSGVNIDYDGDGFYNMSNGGSDYNDFDPLINSLGDVMVSFSTPDGNPHGLAYIDGYLYHVGAEVMKIFKMDPNTGEVIGSMPCPEEGKASITWDGYYFWVAKHQPGTLIKIDSQGNILDTISTSYNGICGIAFDGNYLWFSDNNTHRIYQIDFSGNVIKSIPAPAYGGDLTWDGQYLWFTSYYNDAIYKLDTDGNVIDTFASPSTYPSGIAVGNGKMWIADSDSDLIYQMAYSP